jgi:predicted peptidase
MLPTRARLQHLTEPLPCVVHVPADAPAHGLPLLCFLHGYGEAAPLPIARAVTLHGPLHADNAPLIDRCIVVAPQLPVAGDHWHRFADAVRDIVVTVGARHDGDPRRFYLTGFSYGGNGVFDLGLAQPELWAALWPVDPTRVPPRAPARPLWLSIGECARPLRSRFDRVLELQDAATTGTGDRLGLDRGEDHVATAASAYGDPRIYDWLLARRRDA